MKHECEVNETIEVYESEGCWFVDKDENQYISGVKYCPYCGIKLDEL